MAFATLSAWTGRLRALRRCAEGESSGQSPIHVALAESLERLCGSPLELQGDWRSAWLRRQPLEGELSGAGHAKAELEARLVKLRTRMLDEMEMFESQGSRLLMERPELLDTVLLNILDTVQQEQLDSGESREQSAPDFLRQSESGSAGAQDAQAEGSIEGEADGSLDFQGEGAAQENLEGPQQESVEGASLKASHEREGTDLQEGAESEAEAGEYGPSLTSWEDVGGLDPCGSFRPSNFSLYRELLGRLPELQDLVRRMGRKSGWQSPLRFDLSQRQERAGQGTIRSPNMPAETSGVTRSDGRLLLLPSEMSLLAYSNSDKDFAKGAKALHRLRRAEAALLSYERSYWMDVEALAFGQKVMKAKYTI